MYFSKNSCRFKVRIYLLDQKGSQTTEKVTLKLLSKLKHRHTLSTPTRLHDYSGYKEHMFKDWLLIRYTVHIQYMLCGYRQLLPLNTGQIYSLIVCWHTPTGSLCVQPHYHLLREQIQTNPDLFDLEPATPPEIYSAPSNKSNLMLTQKAHVRKRQREKRETLRGGRAIAEHPLCQRIKH